jgi:hypothetical protein
MALVTGGLFLICITCLILQKYGPVSGHWTITWYIYAIRARIGSCSLSLILSHYYSKAVRVWFSKLLEGIERKNSEK